MKFVCLYLLVGLTAFTSCKNKNKESENNILAEYRGKFLYKNDIPSDVMTRFGEGDSAVLLKAYIDSWLENQVMVAAAEESLSDEEKNKEKLIEDYRNSLLIYEYQQKLIKENLDTGVTEEEIVSFYDDNKASFLLRKNIVKIKYVKINKLNADLNKLKKLMQNASPENDAALKVYAEDKADNFYLDSSWLYLDDITKEIPLDANYDQQRFLSNNKFIQIEEKGVLYLLYIMDFRIKNATSPLEFEREKIIDIIRYKRRLDFLKTNKKTLFEKALESNEIKYHIKKK